MASDRKFFVGGNWKMNGSKSSIDVIIDTLKKGPLSPNTGILMILYTTRYDCLFIHYRVSCCHSVLLRILISIELGDNNLPIITLYIVVIMR